MNATVRRLQSPGRVTRRAKRMSSESYSAALRLNSQYIRSCALSTLIR